MKKVEIEAIIDIGRMKELDTQKGELIVSVVDTYYNDVKCYLEALREKFGKASGYLTDVILKERATERTQKSNRFLWKTLTVYANELNGNPSKMQEREYRVDGKAVTKDDLYDTYVRQICDKTPEMRVKKDDLWLYQDYRVKDVTEYDDGTCGVVVYKSTSHMDSHEMYEFTNVILNDLEDLGVSYNNQSFMKKSWIEYWEHVCTEKLFPCGPMTPEKYRATLRHCEATGVYLPDGSGSVHHIKTVGSGGKDIGENYLLLSDSVHVGEFHGHGGKHFFEKYPHLKSKIEEALSIPAEQQELFDPGVPGDNDIF